MIKPGLLLLAATAAAAAASGAYEDIPCRADHECPSFHWCNGEGCGKETVQSNPVEWE